MKARVVARDDKGKPIRWRVDLDLGIVNGKRKRKAVYGKTERAALKKAEQLQAELRGGVDPAKERATLGEVFDRFLEYSLPPRTDEGTYESYRHITEAFLRPAFGAYRARRLRAEDVDSFLGNLSREINPRTKKPYAASYQLKVYTVLRRALNLALRWGYVGFNAAARAEPPKVPKRRGESLRARSLSDVQIRAVLQVAAGHRYAPIYHVLIVTGLRRGEVLGLRWVDVDLDAGLLYVTGALKRSRRPTQTEGTPKTERKRDDETKSDAGTRVLVLTPSCVAVLRQVKEFQTLERSVVEGYGDSGYIFTSSAGGPIEPRQLTKHFKEKVVPAVGLPPATRLHDLRHANITAMVTAGVDPKTAQERAGHADIKMTLHYSHSNLDLQRAAAAAIDARFQLGGEAA